MLNSYIRFIHLTENERFSKLSLDYRNVINIKYVRALRYIIDLKLDISRRLSMVNWDL